MIGQTIALAGIYAELKRETDMMGMHCEDGCVACYEIANNRFREWLCMQERIELYPRDPNPFIYDPDFDAIEEQGRMPYEFNPTPRVP